MTNTTKEVVMAGKIRSSRVLVAQGMFGSLPAPYAGPGNAVVLGMVGGVETVIFHYYTDEIGFVPAEVDGLTMEQAQALKQRRDIAYLRS
jgi:hypothetical protein